MDSDAEGWGGVTTSGSEPDAVLEPLASASQRRRPGRPKGTYGTYEVRRHLREVRENALAKQAELEEATPASVRRAANARAVKKSRREPGQVGLGTPSADGCDSGLSLWSAGPQCSDLRVLTAGSATHGSAAVSRVAMLANKWLEAPQGAACRVSNQLRETDQASHSWELFVSFTCAVHSCRNRILVLRVHGRAQGVSRDGTYICIDSYVYIYIYIYPSIGLLVSLPRCSLYDYIRVSEPCR
jgi:hypothetical protein